MREFSKHLIDISKDDQSYWERDFVDSILNVVDYSGNDFSANIAKIHEAYTHAFFGASYLPAISKMIENPEEFKAKIEADEFLEYEEVYQDRFYGTLKSQVENQLEAGDSVVFDVDVKGGVNIKKFYGGRALSIFVQPPSVEELRRRLNGRGTDAPEVIEQRLAKANYELTFAPQFDHIVVNDNLEKAEQEVYKLVSDFLNQE